MQSLDRMDTLPEVGGMVLVMGVTGAGKSTFVNALKPESVTVGHNLESSKRITSNPWVCTGHRRLAARMESPCATASRANIPG